MDKRLMVLSMACGLAMAAPAMAASFHAHTSSSVHVTSKNGETNVEASYSENGASVNIRTNGNESISISAPSLSNTLQIRSDSDDESDEPKKSKKSRASVSIRSSIQEILSQFRERREMRVARRICWKFGNDKEECLEDALNGEGSTVRAKLRAWIGRL